MPRNAFLGIPRIWFSLRSLNKKRRGTGVKDPARLYLHLIMITKPLWWLSLRSVFGGLFSLRPRAGSSPHTVPLEVALLKWLAGGHCLQGGLCGWSRTSRPRAKRWVNCCTLNPVLFCHLQEMTPSSPPPRRPSPRAGSAPLPLPSSQELCLCHVRWEWSQAIRIF